MCIVLFEPFKAVVLCGVVVWEIIRLLGVVVLLGVVCRAVVVLWMVWCLVLVLWID